LSAGSELHELSANLQRRELRNVWNPRLLVHAETRRRGVEMRKAFPRLVAA